MNTASLPACLYVFVLISMSTPCIHLPRDCSCWADKEVLELFSHFYGCFPWSMSFSPQRPQYTIVDVLFHVINARPVCTDRVFTTQHVICKNMEAFTTQPTLPGDRGSFLLYLLQRFASMPRVFRDWWHPPHLTCNQWTGNPLSSATWTRLFRASRRKPSFLRISYKNFNFADSKLFNKFRWNKL